jgi:hypothetical protein
LHLSFLPLAVLVRTCGNFHHWPNGQQFCEAWHVRGIGRYYVSPPSLGTWVVHGYWVLPFGHGFSFRVQASRTAWQA